MTVAALLKKRLITQPGKTVTQVADEIGMSRPAFSNVINGNAALSIELALKLEEQFGLDARRLLIRQLDQDIAAAKIPNEWDAAYGKDPNYGVKV
jgi:antitoxin HigA-1